MTYKTPTTCGECGIPITARTPGTKPPTGTRFHMGSGPCTACYFMLKKAGTLTAIPPVRYGTVAPIKPAARANDPRTYIPARDRTGTFGRFQMHPTHLKTLAPSGLTDAHEAPLSAPSVDPATARSASLLVCGRAADVDEARALLTMLGLVGAS